MVADWIMARAGTPEAGVPIAVALPGVRRPRQQPRRVHAEHGRVARHGARLAPVGAEHHLRAPSVVSAADADLAAAVCRADRHARAVPDVARGEHDRHGDREASRRRRQSRRDAHGHRLRRVVSGLHRLRADVQEHPGVLDRDAGTRRGPAADRPRHDCAEHAPAAVAVREPMARRHLAVSRRRRVHDDRVDRDAGLRGKVQELAALQPVPRRPESDREGPDRGAVRVRRSAGAARSGRGRRDAPASGVRRRAVSELTATGDRRRCLAAGGHLGRADRSGVCRARARSARRPEVPGDSGVAKRPARHAVRRRRLDVAARHGRAHHCGRGAALRRRSVEVASTGRSACSRDGGDAVQPDRNRRPVAIRHGARNRLRQRSGRARDRAAGRTSDRDRSGACRESRGEQRVQGHQPRLESPRLGAIPARSRRGRRAVRDHRTHSGGAGRSRQDAGADRGARARGVRRRTGPAAHRVAPCQHEHGRRLDTLGARPVRVRVPAACCGRLEGIAPRFSRRTHRQQRIARARERHNRPWRARRRWCRRRPTRSGGHRAYQQRTPPRDRNVRAQRRHARLLQRRAATPSSISSSFR